MFSKMENGKSNSDTAVEVAVRVKYFKTKMTSGSKLVQHFALTGGSDIQILSHFPIDEQDMFNVGIQKFKLII